MVALKSRFVDQFPDSTGRGDLYGKFTRWRSEAANIIPAAIQWVNGSYVTTNPKPHDVDVVTFCDGDFLDTLAEELEETIENHLNGREATIPDYGTYSILIGARLSTHPDFAIFEAERRYFRKWYGQFNSSKAASNDPRIDQPKGFLELTIGDQNLVPAISQDRADI